MPKGQRSELATCDFRLVTGRHSFTLIELLIAAAIAGLLFAVVLAVYGSILNTVAVQNRWREKVTPAAGALDLIIRDMACAVVPAGVTNQTFTAAFFENAEESYRINFYSAFPIESSNDWRGYSISTVAYSLRSAGNKDEFVLLRECKPFRAPSRNPLSSGRAEWRAIKKFDVAFFNGSAWTNRWGNEKNTNALPQAARIKITAGKNNPHEIGSEVFINTARQIVPQKTEQPGLKQ